MIMNDLVHSESPKPPVRKRRTLADRLKMAAKASLDSGEQRAAQQALESMDRQIQEGMTQKVTSDTKSHNITQSTTEHKKLAGPDDSKVANILDNHVLQEDLKGTIHHGDVKSSPSSLLGSDTKSHTQKVENTPTVAGPLTEPISTKKSTSPVGTAIAPSSHSPEKDYPREALQAPKIRSSAQVRLYDYLYQNGAYDAPVLFTLSKTSAALNITPRSILRIFKDWEEKGILSRKSDYLGTNIKLQKNYHEVGLLSTVPMKDEQRGESSTSASIVTEQAQASEQEFFGISGASFHIDYPSLHKIGFGMSQLKQVHQKLQDSNLSTDLVKESLSYAEYELMHGVMKDSKGKNIDRPADWLFICLSKNGHYRRPQNYQDPVEKARKELEALIKAKEASMAALTALREKQVELEKNEIIEERLQNLLANPDSPELATYLEKVSESLRFRGVQSSLVQRSLRLILEKELLDC